MIVFEDIFVAIWVKYRVILRCDNEYARVNAFNILLPFVARCHSLKSRQLYKGVSAPFFEDGGIWNLKTGLPSKKMDAHPTKNFNPGKAGDARSTAQPPESGRAAGDFR